MDIQVLTRFFMWCTIINGGLLLVSFLITMLTPIKDVIYELHSKWFPMPRETFNMALYTIIG